MQPCKKEVTEANTSIPHYIYTTIIFPGGEYGTKVFENLEVACICINDAGAHWMRFERCWNR